MDISAAGGAQDDFDQSLGPAPDDEGDIMGAFSKMSDGADTRGGSSTGAFEDGVKSDAMAQAMNDVADIVNRASSLKEKLSRGAFKSHLGKGTLKTTSSGDAGGARVLAVIPAQSKEQVISNVKIAIEAGVSGVFLTNPDFDYPQLLPILRHCRATFPDLFLGANFYTVNGLEAFPILGRLAREGIKIDAYYADNSCLDHEMTDQPMADRIQEIRSSTGWDGLYLGGTACSNPKNHAKLCKKVPLQDCKQLAETARKHMDVVITTASDGGAIETEKIAAMRQGSGNTPLGIIGADLELVQQCAKDIDCFLVDSYIQADQYNIDPVKLRSFLAAVREASG